MNSALECPVVGEPLNFAVGLHVKIYLKISNWLHLSLNAKVKVNTRKRSSGWFY